MRDTAFREITARANAVSKSEQDFRSVLKKEVAGKPAKTRTASRRYSVASKFGGSKSDNANSCSSGIAAGDAKAKLNNQTSFLGTANGPPFNGTSTLASLSSGKIAAIHASKVTAKKSAAPVLQETTVGCIPRSQVHALEQAIKLQKPTLDLHKRSMFGNENAKSTHKSHDNKDSGMLLMSAHYWLEQVKLAEVMEKHGVSIGFFRLAVECEAEPVELLREELIAYIKRHSFWSNAIQQVLLCYHVTDDTQCTLFSQLSANCIIDSSTCTPAKNLEGMLANDEDPAGQVPENDLKCSEASFDDTRLNNTVEQINVKEEAFHSQKSPVPDASGIKSMDADSVTREVVTYIMSSLKCPDSSTSLKNDVLAGPKDRLMFACSDQNNHGSSALLVAKDPVICVQESISILSSAEPEEASSTGSLPSLSVWNTSSKEVDALKLNVQEEVSITLGNDINDSVSTEKVIGEDICISMELDVDDAMSDNQSDLQSKSPNCQGSSSEWSHCHGSETRNAIHENVAKDLDTNRSSDEVISADDNCEGLSKILFHEESHDMISEMVQVPEGCENGSHQCRKMKTRIPKTLQTNAGPESQGDRKSCSFGGRPQYGKEKSTLTSDQKIAEIRAPRKDNATTSVARNSRCLSVSTPKSSISVHVPNVEAGSRTRRKSRISQLAVTGNERYDIHQKIRIAAEDILATPKQEKTVEVGDGCKQISLSTSMDGGTVDAKGAMATPGIEMVNQAT